MKMEISRTTRFKKNYKERRNSSAGSKPLLLNTQKKISGHIIRPWTKLSYNLIRSAFTLITRHDSHRSTRKSFLISSRRLLSSQHPRTIGYLSKYSSWMLSWRLRRLSWSSVFFVSLHRCRAPGLLIEETKAYVRIRKLRTYSLILAAIGLPVYL